MTPSISRQLLRRRRAFNSLFFFFQAHTDCTRNQLERPKKKEAPPEKTDLNIEEPPPSKARRWFLDTGRQANREKLAKKGATGAPA
jgi:hypothetical protein